MEKQHYKERGGLSMGTVMRRKDWKLLAPSMLAASVQVR